MQKEDNTLAAHVATVAPATDSPLGLIENAKALLKRLGIRVAGADTSGARPARGSDAGFAGHRRASSDVHFPIESANGSGTSPTPDNTG